jgi:hypothetical protein
MKDNWISQPLRWTAHWKDLRLEDETSLRIFISDATFSTVEPKDLPAESVKLLSKFRQGIRVALQNEQMQWFLLARSVQDILDD